MAIQIDNLIVRGSFGAAAPRAEPDDGLLDARLSALRHEIMDEIARALDAAERRQREG